MKLRAQRVALGISQSRLARLAKVSRFKVCTYELGSGSLTPEEHDRIREALLSEADRLRNLSLSIDLGGQEEVR
jgi:predicted transcriptional regulator